MKHLKSHKEYINENINFGSEIPKGAVKVPLSELFGHPVNKPYIGLCIKLSTDIPGVIIDVFQRNDDYLFDIVLNDGDIEKNLSWNRDVKTIYGDIENGWSAFGEKGIPNQRHANEIKPKIINVMNKFGFEAQTKEEVGA